MVFPRFGCNQLTGHRLPLAMLDVNFNGIMRAPRGLLVVVLSSLYSLYVSVGRCLRHFGKGTKERYKSA